jgi:hypothetical protein
MKLVRRGFWLAVAVGALLAVTGAVPVPYVLAPLLGLAIWRVGIASFASLRQGSSAASEAQPEPVDPRTEWVTYWCGGCGAELLLVARGAQTPPRHCGERMTERREVASDSLN